MTCWLFGAGLPNNPERFSVTELIFAALYFAGFFFPVGTIKNSMKNSMKNSTDRGGCYSPRPSATVNNSHLDLQNSLCPTRSYSVIARKPL